MSRVFRAFVTGALIALSAGPLLAQQPANQSAPPLPAPSRSQAVIDSWNEIGRKLVEVAEDFPENKYDYKATPPQRTFAEVLLHVIGTSYVLTDAANGKEPRPHDLARSDYKTKADIVAALKKAVEEGAAALKARGDKGMSDTVRMSFNNQMTRILDLAYGMSMHASEHYGQLVVYYRLNDLVPPESRPETPASH
jgi:uncharacterized damage-inducible protein DinB